MGNALQLPLVLASASPRRKELLSLFGLPFTIVPSQAEESARGSGTQRVGIIAREKGLEVLGRREGHFVLSADTLVCVEDQVLGKPRDRADAARMLRLLSGRWHQVHTGVCLLGPEGYEDARVDTTCVAFEPMDEAMIQRYVASGEPMDKAGAYAIQGISGIFISRIEGSPSNVMGLPLALAGQMLMDAGFSLLPSLEGN